MTVVGVDTSSPIASIALVKDGQLIAERCHPGPGVIESGRPEGLRSNHAEIVLPLIQSVMMEAGLSLAEVTGIAVAIGPGSFTGLRIGLSTVKGLAYGWGVPVLGISTLLAQAARVGDYEGTVCSLLDARKSQVYAALFSKRQQVLTRLTDDLLLSTEDAIGRIRAVVEETPCLVIGDGGRRYEKELLKALGDGVRLGESDSVASCAAAVARLGSERLRNFKSDELGELEPLYLRPSEAEAKRCDRI